MRDRVLRNAALALSIFGVALCWAINGKSISGRAVSVQYLQSQTGWGNTWCRSGGSSQCGSIDLFTISGGKVVRTDTVFSRSRGYCFSPAFNICGTKIAFYRLAVGPTTGTACASVNGGKNTISVMDISGNNLVNLCDVGSEPKMAVDGTGGLDWPAGDWIYYLKTPGGINNVLWKVNFSSLQNVQVCAYSTGGSYFRRFSLDLAADRMGAQWIGGSSYGNGCIAFPSGCNLPGGGNCNMTLSASGNYEASFQGDHTRLVLWVFSGVTGTTVPSSNLDAYRINTVFQPTTTDRFGADVDGLSWACNSDKWVLQNVGWCGHATEMKWGTEQVATNWVDIQAIRISNNGKKNQETCPPYIPGPDCCGGCGTVFPCNDQGDLWVDGGPANAGKYEDASGVWHSASGISAAYCPVSATGMPGSSVSMSVPRALTIVWNGRAIELSLPAAASWRIEAVDSRGRIVASRTAVGDRLSMQQRFLAKGTYIVTARSEWGEVSRKFVID